MVLMFVFLECMFKNTTLIVSFQIIGMIIILEVITLGVKKFFFILVLIKYKSAINIVEMNFFSEDLLLYCPTNLQKTWLLKHFC